MTVAEKINTAYLLPDEQSGPSFPALQADTYKPANLKQKVRIGMSGDSFDMLPDSIKTLLKCEETDAVYGGGEAEVKVYLPTGDVRWIIIGRPNTFVYDKDDNSYGFLEKGMKLAGTKKVTAARLLLACAVDNKILLNDDGEPQIFTLKLTSSKTALLGGSRSQPGDGSIMSLNTGLCKHYEARGWLTHLVSVDIQAVPEKFTQRNGTESSIGIRFVLAGNARILPETEQALMFKFAQKQEIKDLIKDPFGINRRSDTIEAPAPTPATTTEAADISFDDIPF